MLIYASNLQARDNYSLPMTSSVLLWAAHVFRHFFEMLPSKRVLQNAAYSTPEGSLGTGATTVMRSATVMFRKILLQTCLKALRNESLAQANDRLCSQEARVEVLSRCPLPN
jgi:hypothetical protein